MSRWGAIRLKNLKRPGELVFSLSRELTAIGGIESFEITIVIGLLFTGFEGKQGTVGMVHADIGHTGPE